MSNNKVVIRRDYVEKCERFWHESGVILRPNKLTNINTLTSVADAKSYIKTASTKIWELDTSIRKDRMFINTLYANCEQAGVASTEYFTAQYDPGQQYGECKYILVVIYNNGCGSITVAYAYHDIDETIFGSQLVYTKYAASITEHWLKSKSVDRIREILDKNAWPTVEYQ